MTKLQESIRTDNFFLSAVGNKTCKFIVNDSRNFKIPAIIFFSNSVQMLQSLKKVGGIDSYNNPVNHELRKYCQARKIPPRRLAVQEP